MHAISSPASSLPSGTSHRGKRCGKTFSVEPISAEYYIPHPGPNSRAQLHTFAGTEVFDF